MKALMRIVLVILISAVVFAQDEAVTEENKTEIVLHLTTAELQAHNRIVAEFKTELENSLDVAKALDVVCEKNWKEKLFTVIITDGGIINLASKDEILKSEYLGDYISATFNLIFLKGQYCLLLPKGHETKDCIPAGYQEKIDENSSRFRDPDNNSSSLINYPNNLYFVSSIFEGANDIMRTALREVIQNPRKEAVNKFSDFTNFNVQPEVTIDNDPESESAFGIPAGTRLVKASSKGFDLYITKINGSYRVVMFSLNYID